MFPRIILLKVLTYVRTLLLSCYWMPYCQHSKQWPHDGQQRLHHTLLWTILTITSCLQPQESPLRHEILLHLLVRKSLFIQMWLLHEWLISIRPFKHGGWMVQEVWPIGCLAAGEVGEGTSGRCHDQATLLPRKKTSPHHPLSAQVHCGYHVHPPI
jgi:hypothetical protein